MPLPFASSPFFKRFRRLAGILAGAWVLWLLTGFLLVPALVRPRLERAASAFLKRPVTLAKVRFNPLTLGTTLEGLRVAEPGGGDWITLRRLYVNYELAGLLHHAVTLADVEVEGLTVRAALDAKGRLNFQDMLAPGAPEAPAAPVARPWSLAVDHLLLSEGHLELTDRSRSPAYQRVVGPLSFRADGLRTELNHENVFLLEAWTEAREHLLWKGEFSVQPLASRGSLLLENLDLARYRPYLREELTGELRSGTATLRSDYTFAHRGGRPVLELAALGLSLKHLQLAEPGAAEAVLDLPSVEVKDGQADLLAPSVELGSLRVDQGRVRLKRSAAGLNLVRLLAPPHPRAPRPDAKPLALKIRDLRLQGLRLGWEDTVPVRPVQVEATDLNLRWQDLSLDPAATSRAALDFKLGTGSLQLEGTLAVLKLTADLRLQAHNLVLAPFDPYLDGALALRVATGSVGADGRLRLAFEGRKTDGITYQGGFSVQQLELRDAARSEPFLRWKQLRLTGLDLRTAPLALAIQTVDWTEPEGRLVVQPDGRTNVAGALRLEEGAKPASVTASAVPATPTAAPDLRIQKVAIRGGRLSFIDRSLQPNAALLLSDLEGSYLGLSSRPDAASEVSFRGRAGGLAPITITGHAMPLRHDLDTDVTLKIQGADLTDFTPYTGKYLGYTVQKGKLDVDARLRIDHRNLQAENAIKLDQFYLGDKVDSPDATGLPVKFGLAILRDRKGAIAFDLPIGGSLDDPDVKYGRLVWKAIFGLLGKIATSPFTLIGKLFGGDAGDLSSVAFAPGASGLDPAATARLQALGKALQERPELRLEAEGAVAAEDDAALRRAALEALLRRTRARELKLAEEGPVPPPERERWLRAAFVSAFPPAKDAPAAPPPPPAELEQRLLGTLAPEPAELTQLADRRAKAVLAWLLDNAQADPERIFQVRTGQAKGAAVAFTLK